MKIIIDSYIPYLKGVFDALAEVEYLSHKEITSETVRDADALIIRTRTRCDEKLLRGSKVKFIASATIGYDHIDTAYCSRNGIETTNAPGCNTLSVAQYIASALSFLALTQHFELREKTIGIVGVGAVGAKIESLAKGFGMKVLLNDPPRERKEGNEKFVPLSTICQEADIISFHTPLNKTGEDATLFLADEKFFSSLKKQPIIINAARGEIVKSEALLQAYQKKLLSGFLIDCWENEPKINKQMLAEAILATPHIAGYSAEGKANAATQSVRAVSRFFSLPLNDWSAEKFPAPPTIHTAGIKNYYDFFLKTYDIESDSNALKTAVEKFEDMRSNYYFRREPQAYLPFFEEKFRKEFKKDFSVFQ